MQGRSDAKMTEIKVGKNYVIMRDGYCLTVFSDGKKLTSHFAEQEGQRETAKRLGFNSVWEMNQTHDLTHSILANWFKLKHSPTLYGLASKEGTSKEIWNREEEAVLALQAYAKALGIDLIRLALSR